VVRTNEIAKLHSTKSSFARVNFISNQVSVLFYFEWPGFAQNVLNI